jgi:hypothetical protein
LAGVGQLVQLAEGAKKGGNITELENTEKQLVRIARLDLLPIHHFDQSGWGSGNN